MQTTKKLSRVLRDLIALLEEEAIRNPEFAASLERITAALPERAGRHPARVREGEIITVPDVLAEFQAKGEVEFRLWLRDFSLSELKAIVKRNGFDPAKVTHRWTDPDRFVVLISEQVKSRLERGSAFLPPRSSAGVVGLEGSMKRGDVVKYSKPVSAVEAEFRFILLNEPEKGRVDIQLICDDRIKPIETVKAGEIEVAK